MMILAGMLTFTLLGVSQCQEVIQHLELYDATVLLTCSNQEDDVINATQLVTYQWILPSGTLLDLASQSTLNSTARVSLLDQGTSLQIHRLDKPDFGLYTCLVLDPAPGSSGVILAVRHGVNTGGPYYGDQLARYQPNIRTACIAGGAVFLLTALLCCNLEQASSRHDRKLRRQRTTKVKAMPGRSLATVDVSYFNNGLVVDDDDDDNDDDDDDDDDDDVVQFSYSPFQAEMKERQTKF